MQVAELPPVPTRRSSDLLVPTGKLAGALLVTVSGPPQLSLAARVPRLTLVAAHPPLLTVTLTCAGQVVITGGWLSITIVGTTLVGALPMASRTLQVTRLV